MVNRETRTVELVLHDTDSAHNFALTILCCSLWATLVLIKFLESSLLLIPVACAVPLCSLAGVGHTNSECHLSPSSQASHLNVVIVDSTFTFGCYTVPVVATVATKAGLRNPVALAG